MNKEEEKKIIREQYTFIKQSLNKGFALEPTISKMEKKLGRKLTEEEEALAALEAAAKIKRFEEARGI